MKVKPQMDQAAQLIRTSFIWDETKEGFEYWEHVHNKLIGLAEEEKENAEIKEWLGGGRLCLNHST